MDDPSVSHITLLTTVDIEPINENLDLMLDDFVAAPRSTGSLGGGYGWA